MQQRFSERQRAMLGALGLDWWPAQARRVPRPSAPPAARAQAQAEPEAMALPQAEPAEPAAAAHPEPASAAPAAARPAAPARPLAEVLAPLARAPRESDPAPALPRPLDRAGFEAQVRDCRACGLCERRRQAVPGVGDLEAAPLWVIGEAPGEQEDQQGEPFVGAAGQLLDAMLEAIARGRSTELAPERRVYISNAVKCRPPGNRNPSPEEIAACRPHLLHQLQLGRPRLLLALGRFAAQTLLDSGEPIGRLRGRLHAGPLGIPVLVSYHPAYLLRNPVDKAKAWEDLCLAADTLEAGT